MGRFRIQLLKEDNTWNTQYTIPNNEQNTNTLTDWTLFNLNFTVESHCNKLILDHFTQLMCFSNKSLTHSVY